jgi:hypothetical protein
MMKNKTKSSHSFWQIVSYIIPFVFQIKEWKLRAQAFFSFFFVVASICINVCIPIFFKKLIITLELPKNPEA